MKGIIFDFCIIFTVLNAILLSVIYVYQNRNSIKEKTKKFWKGVQKDKEIEKGAKKMKVKDENGNPVKETVIEGRRNNMRWGRTVGRLIPFILIPLLVLSLLSKIGPLGTGIVVGFLVAVGVAITSRERTIVKEGVVAGIVVAIITAIYPPLIYDSFRMAAFVFLFVGVPNHLLEEFTGLNAFPWYTLHFCAFMATVNLVHALLLLVAGHDLFTQSAIYNLLTAPNEYGVSMARKILEYIPFSGHVAGEGYRAYSVLSQLVDILQWIMAAAIILITTAYGEIRDKLENLQILNNIKNAALSLFGYLHLTRDKTKK